MNIDKLTSSEIDQAVELLRNGDVVGLPTETVYGLAGSIYSEQAIEKIFSIKERPFFDPLIVHISELSELETLAEVANVEILNSLSHAFWPGPLTIILPKKQIINPLITSGLEFVGIRIPKHPFTLEVIKRLGQPLAMPSANKFSKTSPTTAQHVKDSFSADNLFVLDGGESEVGLESTVIRLVSDGLETSLEILRPGFITSADFKELLPDLKEIKIVNSNLAPGHVKHHYMPNKPLILIPASAEINSNLISEANKLLNSKFTNPCLLTLSKDPVLAARELYAKLRSLGESNADLIFINEPPSKIGIWEAIWDRLSRAISGSLLK
jgi:L-threonylcarbamoyladenylate synthase